MGNKTTVLVVGLGSIGQRHARLLSERQDVELHICYKVEDYRAQTIASIDGRKITEYADFTIALKNHPDIIFICVPNQFHVSVGLEAIKSGADIFVEKPISDSIESARKLVAAAESEKRFMQVGYMLRLDEGLRKMKELVEKGSLGNLIGGRAMIGTYITLLNAKNQDRIKYPNSLIVDYTHEIDFIRWFFGEVADIKAMGAQLGNLDMRPQPNIFQMILKMKSGALVQVHMDYIQYPQRRIFEIYGDRGTLSYDFMTGEIRHFSFQKEHRWEDISVLPITDRWDGLFRAEHEMVFSRRNSGLAPIVSGQDGLRALEIAEMAITAMS
ncbi:MAG TPA: Gfo/Idh/MocA family oxidoreductase [Hanamia sp.]|nr:Gfo/Idh/MocA family oxidoreductase [Hanamia sp.]